jgi:hypothetical protein
MKEGRPAGRPQAAIITGISTDGKQLIPCVAYRRDYVADSFRHLRVPQDQRSPESRLDT